MASRSADWSLRNPVNLAIMGLLWFFAVLVTWTHGISWSGMAVAAGCGLLVSVLYSTGTLWRRLAAYAVLFGGTAITRHYWSQGSRLIFDLQFFTVALTVTSLVRSTFQAVGKSSGATAAGMS